ncbi:BadF/BadG/BcrA/BcrD ATPase family protein [Owenweeksia hongkongensis]|uniref:BadF/BadG/BcrA/BcrD ATPase family protein n=1 Tax=Owenweeksia hongkongensis TaxID=253245 RepID=UPI003A9564E2
MIYIADSGSTKCDHIILKEDGTELIRFETKGFNPQFCDAAFISVEMGNVTELKRLSTQVMKAYFFGSGCSTPELNQKVKDGLSPIFPNAIIQVDHDLMASAYASYSGKPAVTCILGTGSNAVYFDGNQITKGIAGTGYILGDEGSASYIGKKVLSSYLYKTMPEEFRDDFDKSYGLSRSEILKQVYEKPFANVFIASFATFASKHLESPFFHDLVYDGFESFLKTQVLYFDQAPQSPIHFIGSVAFHFNETLKEVVQDLKLNMGNVIQKPIDGLVQYFLEYHIDSHKSNA